MLVPSLQAFQTYSLDDFLGELFLALLEMFSDLILGQIAIVAMPW